MSVIDDLKSVGKTLNDIGKVEEYKKILESWQIILEMQEENDKLKKSNSDLKEKLELKGNLVKDDFVYFLEKDGNKEGPFCSRCWEKNKVLITLQQNKVGHWNFLCPECGNKVTYRN